MPRPQKDYTQINLQDLTTPQIRQLLPQLGRVANNRLYKLNSTDTFSGAARRANFFLSERDRKLFPVGSKTLSDVQVRQFARESLRFLQSQTSTFTGIRDLRESTIQGFRERGLNIDNPDAFFQFLSSDTFKTISQIYDSDEVLELIDLDLSADVDLDRIIQAYEDFLLNDLQPWEVEAIQQAEKQFR